MSRGGMFPTVTSGIRLSAYFIFFFLLSGCITSQNNALVEKCKDESGYLSIECVTAIAIEKKDSDICQTIGGNADVCAQEYYIAMQDPKSCEKLSPGMKINCEKYYGKN